MGINAQSELMIAIPFTRGRAHDAANDHEAARWPAESTPRGLRSGETAGSIPKIEPGAQEEGALQRDRDLPRQSLGEDTVKVT